MVSCLVFFCVVNDSLEHLLAVNLCIRSFLVSEKVVLLVHIDSLNFLNDCSIQKVFTLNCEVLRDPVIEIELGVKNSFLNPSLNFCGSLI